MTRQLTPSDYWEARIHPKDFKRYDDGMTMGCSYLVRHAIRDFEASKAGNGLLKLAPVPFLAVLHVTSLFAATLPCLAVNALQKHVFPMQQRSDLATREDAMARSLFAVSTVVRALAGTTQYDASGHPIAIKKLKEVHARTEMLCKEYIAFANSAPPRIRDAKSLDRSINYLGDMSDALNRKIARCVARG